MNRIFEAWFGAQSSGKTYQLRKRAVSLAARKSIRAVVIVAPPGEWKDIARPVDLGGLHFEVGRESQPGPILVSDIKIGDAARLERVIRALVSWGDCALVLDEAWAWIGLGSVEVLKARSPMLLQVLVRGRHLERMDDRQRPTHLLLASQYPRTVSHLVGEQAATILVAKPEGELFARWIKGLTSRDLYQRSLELGEHQWLAIRGRDPRRG